MLFVPACSPASSSVESRAQSAVIDRVEVAQIVVGYRQGAPPVTAEGRPWGSQCVSQEHDVNLRQGPAIGADMKVVLIDPPIPPLIAQLIALEMQQCPYVEWAEADVVRFDVPSARDLERTPTFAPVGGA